MTTATTDKGAPVSYLDMSDEDIANIDPSTVGAGVTAEVVTETPAEEVVEVADEVVAKEDDGDEDDADTKATAEVDAEDDAEDKEDEADEVAEKEVAPKKEVPAPKAEVKEDKVVEPAPVDYKAEYERILKPFKANGRDIQVASMDDAISLMQQGANYNKKMQALKPNLKLMKMLENNGMLNEERIGFLIDLEKKDPAAINKLIKDSGLDPMDLDAEKAGSYTPKTHTVDDREMELDSVLDSISDSPSYNRTLDVVSTKWDGASKQVIAGTPQLLKVINDHIESGIYDIIVKEVEQERMLGRLNGLSDIDAYRKVGDAVQARGGFANLGHQEQAPAPVVVQPKPKVLDDTLRDKKRAAASTKTVAPSQVNKDFNPLALSDDEFSKLSVTNFR